MNKTKKDFIEALEMMWGNASDDKKNDLFMRMSLLKFAEDVARLGNYSCTNLYKELIKSYEKLQEEKPC